MSKQSKFTEQLREILLPFWHYNFTETSLDDLNEIIENEPVHTLKYHDASKEIRRRYAEITENKLIFSNETDSISHVVTKLENTLRDIFYPYIPYKFDKASLDELEQVIQTEPADSSKYRQASNEIRRRFQLMLNQEQTSTEDNVRDNKDDVETENSIPEKLIVFNKDEIYQIILDRFMYFDNIKSALEFNSEKTKINTFRVACLINYDAYDAYFKAELSEKDISNENKAKFEEAMRYMASSDSILENTKSKLKFKVHPSLPRIRWGVLENDEEKSFNRKQFLEQSYLENDDFLSSLNRVVFTVRGNQTDVPSYNIKNKFIEAIEFIESLRHMAKDDASFLDNVSRDELDHIRGVLKKMYDDLETKADTNFRV